MLITAPAMGGIATVLRLAIPTTERIRGNGMIGVHGIRPPKNGGRGCSQEFRTSTVDRVSTALPNPDSILADRGFTGKKPPGCHTTFNAARWYAGAKQQHRCQQGRQGRLRTP